jgi:hypothetical protein
VIHHWNDTKELVTAILQVMAGVVFTTWSKHTKSCWSRRGWPHTRLCRQAVVQEPKPMPFIVREVSLRVLILLSNYEQRSLMWLRPEMGAWYLHTWAPIHKHTRSGDSRPLEMIVSAGSIFIVHHGIAVRPQISGVTAGCRHCENN